ncbi:PREDICTED: uncharacterized protein LOC109350577 [Lupinus angustifolius]|uniref:uncharacterized protein LOC109350577 n=1 Tax=Lupinus angustifolius TaxID=3871 RepID=UPI00092F2FBD|nr:PREDICTED: uncharacterized protein LOC109350577 [Lupinus angustifolius]
MVAECSGLLLQPHKALVGANAFVHESGIHQDGMIKHKDTYQIISPEYIGLEKSNRVGIVLGKLSGRQALRKRFEVLGYELKDDEVESVFWNFKELGGRKKEGVKLVEYSIIVDIEGVDLIATTHIVISKENNPTYNSACNGKIVLPTFSQLLLSELRTIKKGTQTVIEFVSRVKALIHSLTTIGEIISRRELVRLVLEGLLFEYESFVTTINNRDELCSFIQLESLLMAYETYLERIHPPTNEIFPVLMLLVHLPRTSSLLLDIINLGILPMMLILFSLHK